MYKTEDLPPLPEGARLSSSSPPPTFPALPHMSFDLPLPFQRTTLLSSAYDMSWAQAIQTTSLPPTTVISLPGMQGYMLHQLQPHSIPATSGITFSFHTVPTFQQEAAPLITEPLPPSQLTTPVLSTGTNLLFRSGSLHQSRNQSLDCLTNLHGERSTSGFSHKLTGLPEDMGCHTSEAGGPSSQTTQILPQSYSLRWSMLTGSMVRVLCPPSQRSNLRQVPDPLTMMLPDAIRLFGEVDMAQPPSVLLHTDYDTLFSYFAYELLASPA